MTEVSRRVRQNSVQTSLSVALARAWQRNQAGGWAARRFRWRTLHGLFLERLGLNWWLRAPLFFGRRIWILTGESASSGLRAFGYSEVALTSLMIGYLLPGMRFVDVGSHLGYEAMVACELVGESGRVLALEPQFELAAYARKSLCGLPQARVLEAAAGHANGVMRFRQKERLLSAFSGGASLVDGGIETEVSQVTIDSALEADERPVDLLKIDVEGGELAVLEGSVGVLEEDRPLVVAEVGMAGAPQRETQLARLVAFLEPYGYQPFDFDYDGEVRVAECGASRPGHANVGFVHRSRRSTMMCPRA